MLKKMDEETYEKFWANYSTHIKLGVVEDFSNKSRVAKLLRFTSSNDPEKLTSLDEYIERMKDKQEHIYYMAGETKKQVCSIHTCNTFYFSLFLNGQLKINALLL